MGGPANLPGGPQVPCRVVLPGEDVSSTIVAVSHSILVIVWYLLCDAETSDHDLGPGYYDSGINPERKKRSHIRELQALGYTVTLQPAA
jgi:hypothetical protein